MNPRARHLSSDDPPRSVRDAVGVEGAHHAIPPEAAACRALWARVVLQALDDLHERRLATSARAWLLSSAGSVAMEFAGLSVGAATIEAAIARHSSVAVERVREPKSQEEQRADWRRRAARKRALDAASAALF